MDVTRREMEINYFGTWRVTKALLPVVRRNQGRIVVRARSLSA